jgi:hypothetical protein
MRRGKATVRQVRLFPFSPKRDSASAGHTISHHGKSTMIWNCFSGFLNWLAGGEFSAGGTAPAYFLEKRKISRESNDQTT